MDLEKYLTGSRLGAEQIVHNPVLGVVIPVLLLVVPIVLLVYGYRGVATGVTNVINLQNLMRYRVVREVTGYLAKLYGALYIVTAVLISLMSLPFSYYLVLSSIFR